VNVNRIFAPLASFASSSNTASVAALVALRAATREFQLAAPSFSDEQAAQGLAITDVLRACFLPPAASGQASSPLLKLPAELLTVILSRLDTRDLARLAATCLLLWRDAPSPPPPPRAIGPVETELRRRAGARGLDVGSSLPEGATSWVACLLKRDRRDAQMRQVPLAVGTDRSLFVDKGGRLLHGHSTPVSGQAVDPDGNPNPPTPVSSMQDIRIVSVATDFDNGLALSAQGEVYSWGSGCLGRGSGALGHGDEGARAVPTRIESLSRIERIAAGSRKSAAVDEVGRLFTWGQGAIFVGLGHEDILVPTGLGYEFEFEGHQLTPKRVEALSQDRVVGVAFSHDFTLAVTDAGAVFFFGFVMWDEESVLPRRIEALAETRQRFVAVAAGNNHALALTEEGDLYGWGYEAANGHGREQLTPQLVAALIGRRVKLVYAEDDYSYAVTDKGELFTWGTGNLAFNGSQFTPKRVDGLSGVEIAAVATGLAANADGVVWVVWAFDQHPALGVGALGPDAPAVPTPIPIPMLRVRVVNSP